MTVAALPEAPSLAAADRLLTPDDCAQRMSMSRSFIYQEIKAGRLKAIYLGRMPRVEPAALAAYIEARRQ